MFKKLIIVLVVLAFIAMASVPVWTTRVADEAFKNPAQKMSSEAVRKSIKAKMFIYLFEDARKTAEKAVIYFPESGDMPFFIYNAAICSDKVGNKDAAVYWYGRFIEKYPKHEWVNQAARALDLLKNMQN